MHRSSIFGLVVLLVSLLTVTNAEAATFAEQRSGLEKASRTMRTAKRLAKADRLEKAVAEYKQVAAALAAIGQDLQPRLQKQYQRATDDLSKLKAALVKAGADVPGLPTEGLPTTKTGNRRGTRPAVQQNISFVNQVAPLLSAKCGRCHIDNRRGGFSLATYQALIKGSDSGRVFEPGLGAGSLIIDLIQSGDMPRGGGRVTPAEARLLMAWINEGAKFDGANPRQNLRELTPGSGVPPTSSPEGKPLEVKQPTGKETVSFAADLAPILTAKCRNCHLIDDRGDFEMTTFRQLAAAGVISGRNPASSPLIQRLRGEQTPRMPLRGQPLSEAEIKLFETWIREGATFDGMKNGLTSPRDGLERVVALAKATRATGEELNKMRAEIAERQWHTALSDEQAETITTEHFLVIGTLPKSKLEAIGQQAESSAKQIAKRLRARDSLLGKSRLSLFVFSDQLDYSEFGLMVEQRQLPESLEGHSRFDALDPYGCILSDSGDDSFLVSQQVASLMIAEWSAGRAPDWLTGGAGRALAAELHNQDARRTAWEDRLPAFAASLAQPTDFMRGSASPEAIEALSYGFVKAMLRNSRKFAKLLDAIAERTPVEQAISSSYGRSQEELANVWVTEARNR